MATRQVVDTRAAVRRAILTVLPEDDKVRVEELASLTVGEGETQRFLFRADKLKDIWQLYFLVARLGFDATMSYLTLEVIPRINELILQGKNEIYSTLVFESPLLEVEKKREEITLALNNDRGDLSDMYSCPRCSAPRTYVTTKQTRKADEGSTTFIECPQCRWSGKNTGQ